MRNRILSRFLIVAVFVCAFSGVLLARHPDDEKHKKHVETPEPPAWVYVAGAALLVLVVERKAIKAVFQSH